VKVWVVKIGEPLPTDGDAARLNRAGLLADTLVARGHEVTWWASDFDHARKARRPSSRRVEVLSDRYRIVQLHGRPYRRNVSPLRLHNHRQVALDFRHEVRNAPVPDVIVTAYPTINLSLESVRYAQAHAVPVVVDVRDLWPDIFLDLLPRALRRPGRAAIAGMFRKKRKVFTGADAILGTSEAFVQWGLDAAGRARGPLDRAFAHGYPRPALSADSRHAAEQFWHQQFSGDIPARVICFFGNFAEHVLDLATPIAAARALAAAGDQVHFVFCGAGPSLARMRALAADVPRTYFPGRVGQAEIGVLMAKASAGLLPYTPRWDFESTIPNKVIEYLSGGLPVLSCLDGESHRLLADGGCGVFYTPGDAEGLARHVRALLQDEAGRARMSRQASALFAARFDAAHVYHEYARHIEAVAATRVAPHVTATA